VRGTDDANSTANMFDVALNRVRSQSFMRR